MFFFSNRFAGRAQTSEIASTTAPTTAPSHYSTIDSLRGAPLSGNSDAPSPESHYAIFDADNRDFDYNRASAGFVSIGEMEREMRASKAAKIEF